MIETGVAIKAAQIVFTGFFLSFGFWIGKKTTNKIDTFLITHSAEYKDYMKTQKESLENI